MSHFYLIAITYIQHPYAEIPVYTPDYPPVFVVMGVVWPTKISVKVEMLILTFHSSCYQQILPQLLIPPFLQTSPKTILGSLPLNSKILGLYRPSIWDEIRSTRVTNKYRRSVLLTSHRICLPWLIVLVM